jgi:hypothetical protein
MVTDTRDPNELDGFAEELRQDIIHICGANPEHPNMMPTAFTELVIGDLLGQGEIVTGTESVYYAKGFKEGRVRVTGIGIDEERGQLDLLGSIYKNEIPPRRIRPSDITRAVDETANFAKLAITGNLRDRIDIGEQAYPFVDRIHNFRDQIDRINLFVVSDQIAPATPRLETVGSIGNKPVVVQIWGLEKIHRVRNGHLDEPVDIDFTREFGKPLPCIPSVAGRAEYQAYMAVISGDTLYRIYDQYRTRLLEDNVRNFLQTRGKVNKQILESIQNEPDRFFAYNNGISTVATDIEFTGNGRSIKSLKGWRIVNGGQTTASIHTAGDNNPDSLIGVNVPAKIIVLKNSVDRQFLQNISRYSNSQNKVEDSDFSANDPYFQELQRWSRLKWVTTHGAAQVTTRWYFERTRGQYDVDRAAEKLKVRGGQAKFDRSNPRKQRFDKLQLARAQNAFASKAHIVSLGAQKNFDAFLKSIDSNDPSQMDEKAYESLIGCLILFRETEKIIKDNLDSGYKANIVAYSLAYLGFVTGQALDLNRLFKSQGLPAQLRTVVLRLVKKIDVLIMEGSVASGIRNIGEWCKRQDCWDYIMGNIGDLDVPAGLLLKGPTAAVDSDPDPAPVVHQPWELDRAEWKKISEFAKTLEGVRSSDVAFLVGFGSSLQRRTPDTRSLERLKRVLSSCLSTGPTAIKGDAVINGLFTSLDPFIHSD